MKPMVRTISLRASHRRWAFGLAARFACFGGAVAGLGIILETSLFRSTGSAEGAEDPKPTYVPRAKVAAVPPESMANRRASTLAASPSLSAADVEAVNRAKRMIADCRTRYDAVRDYTCTFYKRERFDGKLSGMHVMAMKARTSPLSFYFKAATPKTGREAIWVKGKNNGKVVAHDAGLVKVVAGTMNLDPKGDLAMEDNRHPITDAGLGHMIDTIARRWEVELKPGLTRVEFHPHSKVGDRECTMIETTHPLHDGTFIFHRVRLYIDDKFGLPIRLEGYDWPKHPGVEPELVEEYTYANLRLNPGLTDRDFDPTNPSYSYGRF